MFHNLQNLNADVEKSDVPLQVFKVEVDVIKLVDELN